MLRIVKNNIHFFSAILLICNKADPYFLLAQTQGWALTSVLGGTGMIGYILSPSLPQPVGKGMAT